METMINVVKLENGADYYEITQIKLNNSKYLILAAVENDDFTVRKLIDENNQKYMIKLDSEEELKNVLKIFGERIEG